MVRLGKKGVYNLRLKQFDVHRCAEKVSFNFFTVLDVTTSATDFNTSVDGTPSMIYPNIQTNGEQALVFYPESQESASCFMPQRKANTRMLA